MPNRYLSDLTTEQHGAVDLRARTEIETHNNYGAAPVLLRISETILVPSQVSSEVMRNSVHELGWESSAPYSGQHVSSGSTGICDYWLSVDHLVRDSTTARLRVTTLYTAADGGTVTIGHQVNSYPRPQGSVPAGVSQGVLEASTMDSWSESYVSTASSGVLMVETLDLQSSASHLVTTGVGLVGLRMSVSHAIAGGVWVLGHLAELMTT